MMNRSNLNRRLGCIVLAVFLTLVSTVICAVLIMPALRPAEVDALAEVKLVPSYPGAGPVSYSDNSRYRKTTAVGWDTRSYIFNRTFDITTASVAFDTSDQPDRVREFYDGQLQRIGYGQVWDNQRSVYEYVHEDDPRATTGWWDTIFGGRDRYAGNLQPATYHNVDIFATRPFPRGDAKSGITQVLIKLTIYIETERPR
jgi:hypothetical protein